MIINYALLKRLTSVISTTGYESAAVEIFKKELLPFCSIQEDCLGNCYAYLQHETEKPTVFLTAHIDEIGFQVTHIDNNGYIYLRPNGGIDKTTLPGSHVVIHTKNNTLVEGVIGKCPLHLIKADERNKLPDFENLWVDTGLIASEVHRTVRIGDPVGLSPNYKCLGPTRITSKGLDNKAGVYIMIEAMKQLATEKNLPVNVCGIATTQEELGARGAKVITSYTVPILTICVDLGFSSDVPDIPKRKVGNISLGSGVILTRNADSNSDLLEKVIHLAKTNKIPHQITAGIYPTGGTDLAHIRVSGNGVQTILLSVPSRYMHTPVEMCDVRDLKAAIDIIVMIITQFSYE